MAACSVLLAFAAAWHLLGERREGIVGGVRRAAARLTSGRVRSLAEAALALGIPARLERAGLGDRVAPSTVLIGKAVGALAGAGCSPLVSPMLPGRLGIAAVPVLVVAGFLVPDAVLERTARLRGARIVGALPDALDLLAVGAAAGRAPVVVLRDICAEPAGPLEAELAVTVAELDCGVAQRDALAHLRERTEVREVAALETALERSRRYGSPLAEQLHAQAGELRADEARRIADAAARAAPKIQLVVAMVLVPSVLLMILAAILAHSDELFGVL